MVSRTGSIMFIVIARILLSKFSHMSWSALGYRSFAVNSVKSVGLKFRTESCFSSVSVGSGSLLWSGSVSKRGELIVLNKINYNR